MASLRTPPRSALGAGLSLCAISIALAGCGAKTGLKVPEFRRDAGPDVADTQPDLPPDVPPDACMPFRAEARLASLDIFLLMDSSGSMDDPTVTGETKFMAVTSAIEQFVVAPESEGLGVALTFFPFQQEEVPRYCTNDARCGGEPDDCFQPDVCGTTGEICLTSGDCPVGDTCTPLGRCAGEIGADPAFCFNIGDICPDGTRCLDFGLCENRTSCEPSQYRPSVPLNTLPDVAPRIVEAMETRDVDGSTPTTPALQGMLERARAWSETNPGSKVIVLLATDGFPAACDPEIARIDPDPMAGIPAASAAAANGFANGIQTFVVGVFEPEDELDARANLSNLALAGGSDEALIVTTDGSVSDELLEILSDLRRDVRTCVYAIPAAGALPDPFALEVRILPPGGAPPIELSRVRGAADCDPVDGGFFFQEDIGGGERPGFIELCPATCSMAAASDDFVVEMQAGCD